MDIGKPRRTYTVEPLRDPVPRARPKTPRETPSQPPVRRRERVPSP